MIKEIHYKNFKALRDATLPLGRFTLIVGANGTGKTTAINSLKVIQNPQKFTYNSVASIDFLESFDLPDRNGTKDVKITIQGNLELTIRWQYQIDKFEETGKYFWGEDISGSVKNALLSTIKSEIFSFDSDKIAESVSISPNIELEENGKNLAGVLDQLRDSEPEKFEQLNRELNNWFPEFNRIVFEVPSEGKKTFLLRTTIGNHKIKAQDLSDGTRLALAYLTLTYLPNPPKIVAFEEPEKGIHPRLLENIQEAMYRLAYPEAYGEKREPVQVIATTHSPYLLDLYKDHPEEIVIASKDEKGVHFERLIDKPHYEEVLQDAPLGEIWYSGILGGVPANL